MRAFYPVSRAFVEAERQTGVDAIVAAWARLTAGDISPRKGPVLSF
jgi:hypothetical protein